MHQPPSAERVDKRAATSSTLTLTGLTPTSQAPPNYQRHVRRMKLRAIAVGLLAGVAGVVMTTSCSPASTYLGNCTAEDTAPDADGLASQATALKFVQAAMEGDLSTARSLLVPEAKTDASKAQIAAITASLKAMNVGQPTLSKAYLLKYDIVPKDIAHVPCMAPGPNRGMDFVAAGPALKQAYVLFTAHTQGEGVSTYTIWLRIDDGAWRIVSFHLDPSRMGGRDAFAWWSIAKEQRRQGHDLNAALLYSTARALLYRGPFYQPAGLVPLLQDMQTLHMPDEIKGKPPFNWTLDGQIFKVMSVSPVGVPGGKVVLALVQQSSDWTTDEDADRQNHWLINTYMKVHPEWSQVFDYIASRTCKPDLSLCFGTMYAKGAGYMKGPG